MIAETSLSSLETLGIGVGVVAGISGLVLGILNYLQQRDTSKPKLLVLPGVWRAVELGANEAPSEAFGVIRIINTGLIPVVPTTIGFRSNKRGGMAEVILYPIHISGTKLSEELQPGHASMFKFHITTTSIDVGRAVVGIATGDIFHASKKNMQKFNDQVRRNILV